MFICSALHQIKYALSALNIRTNINHISKPKQNGNDVYFLHSEYYNAVGIKTNYSKLLTKITQTESVR